MTGDEKQQPAPPDPKPEVEHHDRAGSNTTSIPTPAADEGLQERRHASAKAENPLAGMSDGELNRMAEDYCTHYGFDSEEDRRVFRLGARIAGNDFQWDAIPGLTGDEVRGLEFERDHKYRSLPKTLVGVVVVCVSHPDAASKHPMPRADDTPLQALCAAVQGMDETVVNGAQSFYKVQFGIGDASSQRDSWLLGLLNSAPYLCCAFIGCWLTEPMNARFGRRGTVFVACVISALACLWQGFTSEYLSTIRWSARTDILVDTWWHMFIARFALGLGIGPKSATTRECRCAVTDGAV